MASAAHKPGLPIEAGTGTTHSSATTVHTISGTQIQWMRWLVALRWSSL